MNFAGLAFTSPWLLLGLIALPILWLLLRAIPPAPIRRRFPGVALLLGLKDSENETDKTPWWLLLLRAAAIGAAILGFAGPILHPAPQQSGTAPLLVLIDGGWADARDWPRRIERAGEAVAEAGRAGRPVAVALLTDTPDAPGFQTAEAWAGRIAGLAPKAWAPDDMAAWAKTLPEGKFDSFWLSDGLDHQGRADLQAALAGHGALRVFQSPRPLYALRPAKFEGGAVQLTATRLPSGPASEIEVIARGPDPSGIDRELARAKLAFATGGADATAALEMPPELRNRVQRFEIIGQRTTGAVSLADDSLKRRKVALIGGAADREGLQLLSPTHYLRQALMPVADLIDGGLLDVLAAKPDVIVLADVAKLTQTETDGLLDWLDGGGLLLRFAGPKIAASDTGRDADPLMPVRLREGGRSVGGAMSWGEPKALAPFPEDSPFHGLTVPADVAVNEQVLAQPDPDLAEHTIAALADGTPLVTRSEVGQGQVVLFHVTANAEWSNLPLSGLFVQMLERLTVSTKPTQPEAKDLAGQIWVADHVLDGYGQPQDAGAIAGVPGEDLAAALTKGPTAAIPTGLYAGAERRVALNAVGQDTAITPAVWPANVVVEGLDVVQQQALKGMLLAAALILLSIDILAALWLSGRLSARLNKVAPLACLLLALVAMPGQSRADAADDFAIQATSGVVLAYVTSGDTRVDETSRAGLFGLSNALWNRTSVEPENPMAVNIEKDELAFFPFLYWPITADEATPSAAAYEKLNRYLRTGGMILFDTRDGDIAGLSGTTPEALALQRIAAGLDIPPLEQIPQDHVLTRSFYLLKDFPGRFVDSPLWVEASPPDAEQAKGMPFRNLNDGVTPVIIGGNDWAAAWATDPNGQPMFPIGRGYGGDRQREMALRFGVNVIMHVLTGNYKSDQVHVPALLERLGQ